MRGANLSDANLTNADLTNTKLQGVRLESAILTKAKVPADLPNFTSTPVNTKVSSTQVEDSISESPESNTVTMVSVEEPIQTKAKPSPAKTKINWIIPLGLIILMVISGYFLFIFQKDGDDNSLPQQELPN